jgi:multidrug efflux pump
MSLTDLTLRRRTFSLALLAVIALFGYRAYVDLPRSEDPGFTVRTAKVRAVLPGATTEEVESVVTDPLERAIQKMEELDELESESRFGESIITVRIRDQLFELDVIWEDLRNKVGRVALPPGTRGPYVNTDFGDVFGTVLAISGEGLTPHELEEAAEILELELLELPNVGQTQILGNEPRRLFLEYDAGVLERYGMSPQYLERVLRERNVIEPGGYVETGRSRVEIVPATRISDRRDLARTLIPVPAPPAPSEPARRRAGDDGRRELIPLSELVTIVAGYREPPEAQVSRNGARSVVIGVAMTERGRITELGPNVLETARRVGRSLPLGVALDVAAYQPGVVKRKIGTFTSNLGQGVVTVLLVTLLALGLRTGFIVGALIPMSILLTFAIMGGLGIGIDQMSLSGLIISLGLLVDAGIVVAEAILVRVRAGRDPTEAARLSVAELKGPLFVSVGTTVAALAPTFLAESTTGEYTAPIAQVVTITLLGSWLLSLTMTPLLCTMLLRRPAADDAASTDEDIEAREREVYDRRFFRWFRAALTFCLRRRILTSAVAGLMLVGAFALTSRVPQSFFPYKDIEMFVIEVELPWDASFARTRQVVAELEEELETMMAPGGAPAAEDAAHVESWTAFIGRGGPRYILSYNPEFPRPNYAYVIVQTNTMRAPIDLVPRVEAWARAELPDARVRPKRILAGPPVDYPIELRLSGRDTEVLYEIAEDVKRDLEAIEGVVNVNDDWSPPVPRLYFDVDEASARRASVTRADIAQSLRTRLDGARLTRARDGTDLIPVLLRGRRGEDERARLDQASVHGRDGAASVPFQEVGELELGFEPAVVRHRDRQRTLTVRADISPATPDVTPFSVFSQLKPTLREMQSEWPAGYDWAVGGSVEESSEAQGSVNAKVPLALLVIVILLLWQFDSLRKTATVVLLLPLALIGVILGLYLTQKAFGFMAFLGVIALFGVLINNAIVLIAKIEELWDHPDQTPQTAIVDATQRRLRPILLTTATTVCGLLPLAIAGGPLFSPMATAI